jgi:hypothetical protein
MGKTLKSLMMIMLVVVLAAVAASAQQIDLKSLDKFAPLAKETTQINMDESMLKSASGFLDDKKGDEAAAKKGTASLKGFYLRSYEFDKEGIFKLEDIKPLLDQLKAPAWAPFLQSREQGEQTEIWMHKTNGEVDGLLLISAEKNELTVINALGIARPEDLAKIGEKLGSQSPKK